MCVPKSEITVSVSFLPNRVSVNEVPDPLGQEILWRTIPDIPQCASMEAWSTVQNAALRVFYHARNNDAQIQIDEVLCY